VEKLSINKLKWIRNLHSKKFRDSEGYFIAEGEKSKSTGKIIKK
jgi:hypothetical protein